MTVTPIETKKIVPPPATVGGFTPILPFPHHKREGDEIRNNQVNTQNHC